MNNTTMDEAHAQDMRKESKLAAAHQMLKDLAGLYEGERFATACTVLADEVWEQRQRIVRRWD